MKNRIKDFFSYARKRHEIYLKKQSDPTWETKDPILHKYRFTNVFRELDKTTVWFRENVRDRLKDRPEVLLATVVFRMLNRIEVGEAVFSQLFMSDEGSVRTAFEKFAQDGRTQHLKQAIKNALPKGPYVTGAYIISTPPGLAKLDGALSVIGGFEGHAWDSYPNWRNLARILQTNSYTLENAFNVLQDVPYFGSFHSYEIVTDLRHTTLLSRAKDVNTWANVGPGAARGLNRVFGRRISDRGKRVDRVPTEMMLEEMQLILKASRSANFWPNAYDVTLTGDTRKGAKKITADWPVWELRDVEHTLCEFDKMERARLGQGRPRGVYRR